MNCARAERVLTLERLRCRAFALGCFKKGKEHEWEVSVAEAILTRGLRSGEHGGHWHRAVLPPDDDDAGIGHMPSTGAVRFQIVSDLRVRRNAHVLIQDCPSHFGAPPDVAVVHDDAAFYQRPGVHAHTAPENRLRDLAARKNAAARHDAVDRLPTAAFLIEDELRRRVRVARTAHRPLPVVEIERGLHMIQVHVRFVVGFDSSYVAPVGSGVDLAGDSVGLEIVGIHRRVTSQLGQNVLAEIMMAAGSFGVGMQQIEQSARVEKM